MDIVLKVWFISLAFIFQTKISYQDCGERFIDEEDISRSRRIIGGNEATMNSWPWLINFVTGTSNDSFQVCSGNLIDPQWILTTAHCFFSSRFNYTVDEWTYIAGDHRLHKTDPYEQVLHPEELYIHPKYTLMTDYSPGDYDIALIRLKKPAKITRQVRTICLPNDTQENIANETHFVAGWGNVNDTSEYKRSRVLKELSMDIIPKDICNSSYGGIVTQRQICADHPGGGQDACFGDSGGPLQYMNKDGKWVLSGTVSWGRGCARKNFYGVYTDVRELLPYIRRIIKGSTKSCGVRNNNTLRPKRIVGGTEASKNAWPWTVNMIQKGTQKQVCGGSIIASNWILTAAHCFLGEGRESHVEEFEYHVGDHVLEKIDEGQQQIVPEFNYVHPDYIPPTLKHPGNFDVCLIKLKYSLGWSDIVTPICLPDSPNLPSANDLRCYAVGWGNTEDKLDYKRPRALKQLRVNVVPHDTCNSNVSYNGSVPETYLCAGFPEGLNDSCYGDSGGPLQCDNGDGTWTVRGLISWGNGCARPNKFGVYSNVSKLMPFLNQVMSGHDLFLQRIEKMTIEEIYKQNPSKEGFLQLCSWSIFSVIKFAHPNVTTIDIVRTWALIPAQIIVLNVVSPKDMAIAFDWGVQNTCKSKIFKRFLEIASNNILISANNDTLNKFGKRINLTIDEMAFFLGRTIGSLLLMSNIKFDKLQKDVNRGKVVEERVSRLMQLVAFLKTLQSGTRIDENKLKEIVRNYSYGKAKNLTDDSLKKIISTNNIDVFTKYVQLENLGIFFGNWSLSYLKGQRLSDVVRLIGIDLDDFESRFSNFDVEDCVDNEIHEVEVFWDISTDRLTLEKLLIASRLMEDQFNCSYCDVNSERYVPDCNVVCDKFDKKDVNRERVVEERVSRLMQLVAFLKTLQSGIRVDENKLKEIVRNYSYDKAKNLTDDSLKKIISTNNIDVFTKYVQLENLGIFFGNWSLSYLKGQCLSDVVRLIGIDLDVFASRFSNCDVEDCVDNKIREVEVFWDISTDRLTLEKLLIASRLMEDQFNCSYCDDNIESFVPDCSVVCVRCTSKVCNPVNIIKGPKVSSIKLALIFGVFSGCLVAFIIILLICFISKQHRSRNASTSEKVMTDEEVANSNQSLAYKTASNNNIVFLPQNKAVNGKSGSYVALECCDKEESRCNGNLESIL